MVEKKMGPHYVVGLHGSNTNTRRKEEWRVKEMQVVKWAMREGAEVEKVEGILKGTVYEGSKQ